MTVADSPTRPGPPPDTTVLVVEDEAPLAELVGRYLERDGHQVVIVHDGPGALVEARRSEPDVVILDLGLPGLGGLAVCRELRTFTDCYVLMLTARGEEADKITGLAVGADDYLTKPFSPRELAARVRVLLRRPRQRRDQTLELGALSIEPLSRRVRLAGELVELTRTEFDLLFALADQPGTARTRRYLIEAVWGPNWVGDEHLVDVHIGHLRRKLGDLAQDARFVRTVRGVGYAFGSDR